MAKKNRRNAHRYATQDDRCRLGWSSRGQSLSVPARLMNLSVSGALIAIDEGEPLPGPGRVTVSFGAGEEHWVRCELLDMTTPEQGPRQLRLRWLEPVPYETFKATVWGDRPAASTTTIPQEEPAARIEWDGEEVTTPTSSGVDRPAIRLTKAPDPEPRPPQVEDAAILTRSLRAEFPGLVEAQRKNQSGLDRVEPIPWLTIAVFSTIILLLLVVAVTRQYGSASQIRDLLGLVR